MTPWNALSHSRMWPYIILKALAHERAPQRRLHSISVKESMGGGGIPEDRGFDCRLSMEDRGFDCRFVVDDAEGEQTIRSGKYNIVADDIRVAFFNGRSLRKPRVVRRGASIKIHFRPNGAIVPKLIFLGCKPKPVFILPPMLTPNVPIIITRKTEFIIFRPCRPGSENNKYRV